MRLQPVSLRGRRFAIQLREIVNEFGRVIPWLDGSDGLQYATNGAYVEDELFRRLGIEEGGITPYQFVTIDRSHEFIGGIVAFARTPERLVDHRNIELIEALEANGAGYISCLQVRLSHRGDMYGSALMRRALNAVRRDYGAAWGVVSDPHLLPWYRSLGAQTPSPIENKDGLWIVTW